MKANEDMGWSSQYKHPNWQRVRLQAMESAGFKCQSCAAQDRTLNVHHKQYFKGRKIWEYRPNELSVLCEGCHLSDHDALNRLKVVMAAFEPGDSVVAGALLCGFFSHTRQISTEISEGAENDDIYGFHIGALARAILSVPPEEMAVICRAVSELMPEGSEAKALVSSAFQKIK